MKATQAKEASRDTTTDDEELIDTLIAISVVSKRLATKLRQENTEKEENPSEQNEQFIFNTGSVD